MSLSKSERRTLAIVAAAVVILLGYKFAYPLVFRGSTQKKVPQAMSTAQAAGLLASAPGIRARHQAVEDALEQVRDLYLSDNNTEEGKISLLALAEEAAAKTGVILAAKGPFGSRDVLPVEVTLELAGSGEAGSMMQFLYAFGNGRYRLAIDRLELSAGEGRLLNLHILLATLLPAEKGRAD